MTLDRKDYKSAIPQLEKRLAEVEKIGKDAFNKFEDVAHQTQLDAAEVEKKAMALDYKMSTTRIQMEYQLCTTGQDPVEANWQTSMPSITYGSYQGKTLWYRSITYVDDIVVQKTQPMTVNLMDGVYSFVNTVSGNTGWTTIDGDKIQTGMITSHNGYCYFDIDNNNFQMKDGASLADSDNALAWDGSLGTLYIKGDLELAKDGISYLKAWLENNVAKLRVGDAGKEHMLLSNGTIQLQTVINGVITSLASFSQNTVRLGDHTVISGSGIEAQNGVYVRSGSLTTSIEPDLIVSGGDVQTSTGISLKSHRHVLRGGIFSIGSGNMIGGIPINITTAGGYQSDSVTVTNASNMYPIALCGWNASGGTRNSALNLFRWTLSDKAAGSCTVNYGVRNVSNADLSTTLIPQILWIDIEYGGGLPRMLG